MYEVYIVTCGGHKDMVEPEKANGDRFFIIKEDAEKYLSEKIIPEARKHYRVQTVIMSTEDEYKNLCECDISLYKSEIKKEISALIEEFQELYNGDLSNEAVSLLLTELRKLAD